MQADGAWPDMPGGTGGVPDTGGAGGSIDGGADGTEGLVDSSPACINLADIPSARIQTADSSTRISSIRVLDGPCGASASMMEVTFYYWEKGYSCPRVGDKVTCEVEATSSAGATTVFTVEFTAVPLSALMLHWQPLPSQITVTFPSLDGLDGAAAGG